MIKFINKKNIYVNKKKAKKIGLYKIFEIYNEQLNYLRVKYKKYKNSIKSWALINKDVNDKIIFYDKKLLLGNIKYKFKGKLRTDEFSFFFKKKREDKELFNIFKLNNLILKEAFSKLNRHGKAFKYIYDMIYRKILKYPYLITIKPKTIIIFEYNNFTQHIIEWKYNKKVDRESLKDIKKWISIKLTDRFGVFKNLNILNYCIFNKFLNKNKLSINLSINKIYRSLIVIKNVFISFEYRYIIKMKKRTLDLDECLNVLCSEYIEEDCNEIYSNYIENIKMNNIYIYLKEKLFILNKNINYSLKKNYKKIININKLNLEFIKALIKNKTYNLNDLKKTFNPMRLKKDTFYYKEKLMKTNIKSSLNYSIRFKYNFLYKLYFLYFFWSMFKLNKIFYRLNKILFNLWNRFYYFNKISSKLNNNNLFFTYLILYKNIFLNIEFENKWNSYFLFVKKNIYNKYALNLTSKIWENIYNQIFIKNNKNMKNYIFSLYNQQFLTMKIHKFINKNYWNYEKINRINNIIDNIWKNEIYKIYYNYNYFSVWKIPSIYKVDFKDNQINKLNVDYEKMNNSLIELFSENKVLMKDYLIDPEIIENLNIINKFNKNKDKLWYK